MFLVDSLLMCITEKTSSLRILEIALRRYFYMQIHVKIVISVIKRSKKEKKMLDIFRHYENHTRVFINMLSKNLLEPIIYHRIGANRVKDWGEGGWKCYKLLSQPKIMVGYRNTLCLAWVRGHNKNNRQWSKAKNMVYQLMK